MYTPLPHTYGVQPGSMVVQNPTGRYALGGYGYMVPGTQSFSRMYLSDRMIDAAEDGKSLSSVSEADRVDAFMSPPSDNADAYYTAAYWTAVAGRLLRSKTLVAEARSLQRSALITHTLPGTSTRTSKGPAVMKAAAKKIKVYAGKAQNREAMRAALMLEKLAGGYKSIYAKAAAAVTAAPQAAADAAAQALLPEVLQSREGEAWKWALGIGGGLLALTVVGLVFSQRGGSGARPHKAVARANPFWRRKGKQRIPWFAVFGLTALAAGDAITPGFPFPGSAIIMVPLAAGAWLAKAAEYGVSPKQLTSGE